MTSKKSLLSQIRDDYSLLIAQSKSKDVEASKELLRQAATYIEKGEQLPSQLADWLSKNLKALAKGADANATFNLKRSRGRPPSYNQGGQNYIGETIHLSKKGHHKGDNSKGSTEGDLPEAQKKFRICTNTAYKYAKNQRDIMLMGEEIDRQIREENED